MLFLNAQQRAGWGHSAYKYFALGPAGPVTPAGGAGVNHRASLVLGPEPSAVIDGGNVRD